MAERVLKLSGKVNWVKVQEDNLDSKFGPAQAVIDFYPDEASLILLTTSGSRSEVKEDEEGNRYVKLKRKKVRSYTDKKSGKVVEEDMGLPYVSMGLNEDGTIKPYKGLIGNGSSAEVKVTVYDTKAFGKGTRLEAINVTDLVEYTPGTRERVAEELYKF